MPKLLIGSEKDIVWVSKEDYKDALEYSWTLTRSGYPWGYVDGKQVYLHRWVADRMGLALDQVIDHKDRDPKNARRENLRYASPQLNAFNTKRAKNNTSGFKGVAWHKRGKAWRASICFNGETLNLGLYNDPISAAVAYDKAAVKYFGREFAATNLKLGYLTEEEYKTASPRRRLQEVRRPGGTGFRGVTKHGNGFRARVGLGKGRTHLGVFSTPDEAAKAYDIYVIENKLNLPTNASLGLLG